MRSRGRARVLDPARPRVVVAHPSPDLYGSDRQLLETVAALAAAGWEVDVYLPTTGPLLRPLAERGAGIRVGDFPVLRKALLQPGLFLRWLLDMTRATAAIRRHLVSAAPDVVLVNTATIPEWLLGARLAGVPTLVHVHEAEEEGPAPLRFAVAAPNLLARRVIANSQAAADVLAAVPGLRRRTTVVHNGVPGPPSSPSPPRRRTSEQPLEIALVGRLSPRKGIDVALEAVARLRGSGVDARLTVCGTAFTGYEWYTEQLRERAARGDLDGAVDLLGYVHPTWPVLARADVVLVPSRVEPFGNAAVEAMHARRPVVASRVQGLREVLTDGETGLLVPPDDPPALAAAIARLAADPVLAARLADAAAADAAARFTVPVYAQRMVEVVRRTALPVEPSTT